METIERKWCPVHAHRYDPTCPLCAKAPGVPGNGLYPLVDDGEFAVSTTGAEAVMVFTFCECGPTHAQGCEFYEPPAPRPWDRSFYRHVTRMAGERAPRFPPKETRKAKPAKKKKTPQRARGSKKKVPNTNTAPLGLE